MDGYFYYTVMAFSVLVQFFQVDYCLGVGWGVSRLINVLRWSDQVRIRIVYW